MPFVVGFCLFYPWIHEAIGQLDVCIYGWLCALALLCLLQSDFRFGNGIILNVVYDESPLILT